MYLYKVVLLYSLVVSPFCQSLTTAYLRMSTTSVAWSRYSIYYPSLTCRLHVFCLSAHRQRGQCDSLLPADPVDCGTCVFGSNTAENSRYADQFGDVTVCVWVKHCIILMLFCASILLTINFVSFQMIWWILAHIFKSSTNFSDHHRKSLSYTCGHHFMVYHCSCTVGYVFVLSLFLLCRLRVRFIFVLAL